ncbi:hypothetical protein GCM10023149_46060 [Mucilaginibacter gynuensis]|uniref:LTXXQ motif family protein n=1 Tax=Mucilaginibacter gynuensis TaxID=1302236 RepID=A0ABP8HBR3_9SPHI
MNRLTKFIFQIAFLLGISYNAFAQVPDNAAGFRNNAVNKKTSIAASKIVSVKNDFLNKQLNLTPAQGKKFWPLYRRYQEQLATIRRLKRLNNTDAQANGTEQINKELYYQTEMLNIKKRYNEEFLKILPPEKVSELYKSESEFNAEVIKQLSERSERAGN